MKLQQLEIYGNTEMLLREAWRETGVSPDKILKFISRREEYIMTRESNWYEYWIESTEGEMEEDDPVERYNRFQRIRDKLNGQRKATFRFITLLLGVMGLLLCTSIALTAVVVFRHDIMGGFEYFKSFNFHTGKYLPFTKT